MKSIIKIPFNIVLMVAVVLQLTNCTDKPVNLSVARESVKEYYESGKFDEELNEVIREGKDKFSKIEFTENSVVIFDVDETALNNYEASKKMGYGYVYEMVLEWTQDAKVPAFPQVKELYDYLLSKGSKIIFLTARAYDEYDATYKNLTTQGYTGFDTLITKNKNEHEMKSVDFKTAKRDELVQIGYDILGTVGDQWSDLEGLHHGIQVKIPNYLYQDVY
ncbi:MAG: HAD family acid phosphatase [Ignavibacteriaceae bacterium]